MPRRLRVAVGGIVYHVLNRAAGRRRLFGGEGDYAAFLRCVDHAHARVPSRVLAYCVMPNHWHLVVWPREDGELSEFVRVLSVTHTQRWHAARGSAGAGPVYQGRFKSFPVEEDGHLLTVCRYVERNPVRAGLVERSGDWAWGSAGARARRETRGWLLGLGDWPVEVGRGWSRRVDEGQDREEEAAVKLSIERGRPLGQEAWVLRTAERLGLASSLRPPGRPRKVREETEG